MHIWHSIFVRLVIESAFVKSCSRISINDKLWNSECITGLHQQNLSLDVLQFSGSLIFCSKWIFMLNWSQLRTALSSFGDPHCLWSLGKLDCARFQAEITSSPAYPPFSRSVWVKEKLLSSILSDLALTKVRSSELPKFLIENHSLVCRSMSSLSCGWFIYWSCQTQLFYLPRSFLIIHNKMCAILQYICIFRKFVQFIHLKIQNRSYFSCFFTTSTKNHIVIDSCLQVQKKITIWFMMSQKIVLFWNKSFARNEKDRERDREGK